MTHEQITAAVRASLLLAPGPRKPKGHEPEKPTSN